jgi:hypothetical protein
MGETVELLVVGACSLSMCQGVQLEPLLHLFQLAITELEGVPEAYQPSSARCSMTGGTTETMTSLSNYSFLCHSLGLMLTASTDTAASFVSAQVCPLPTISGSARSLGRSGILKTHPSSWKSRERVKTTKATSIWSLKSVCPSVLLHCTLHLMYFQFVHPQDQGSRNYAFRCGCSSVVIVEYVF